MTALEQTQKDPPTIVFLTIHKGASTFIAEELALAVAQVLPETRVVKYGSEKILGTDPAELVVPRCGSFFVRVYPGDVRTMVVDGEDGANFEKVKLALLLRDPRDAAISFYYSAAYSHGLDVANAEQFVKRRNELLAMSVPEGVAACAKPAIAEFKAVLRFSKQYKSAFFTSYEELVLGYGSWLKRFCGFAGWSDEVREEIAAITGDPFVPPDTEDIHQHKRRVTPGNWRDVFDDELIEHFKQECGDEMAMLGYDW